VKNRKTSDQNYEYRRYLSSGMRRSVVQFTDCRNGRLVWAVIYSTTEVQKPGWKICDEVRAENWTSSDENVRRFAAAAKRKRPYHKEFDGASLTPGSVYVLPSDYSLEERSDYLKIEEAFFRTVPGHDFVYVHKRVGTDMTLKVIQQQKIGSRTVIRVGVLCCNCNLNVSPMLSRSLEEHRIHALSC